jgi:ribosomal protein L11 methyltransferase
LRWLELSADVDSGDAEVVAEVLGRFGCGGVAIEEEAAWGEDEGHSANQQRRARVSVFLPIDDSLPIKKSQLEGALTHLALKEPLELLQCETDDQQWETAWRKHYKTLKVGQRLIIKPAWEDYEGRPGQVVIELDPGMAFGTGQHATTRLCLVALERLLRPGALVLDLGTGSGIQAIAAAKLGASSVLALDISPTAVGIARSNIEASGLANLVTVGEGTLPWGQGNWQGSFDLVVANIVADVIEELAHPLAGSLKANGVLIAGGIIGERLGGVVKGLEEVGLDIIDVLAEGEWRTIVARAGAG